MTRLELGGCWQRDVVRPPENPALLRRTFELYGVDAKIQVLVELPESDLHLRQGTTITLGGPTTTAIAILGVTASRGERFKLTADVRSDWVIDGVQVSNQELLEDWQVAPATQDNQQLEIRLRQPIDRQQALRVTIVAHRGRIFPGERITQEELRVIHVHDVEIEDDLFCIRCLNNQQLRVAEDAGVRPLNGLQLAAKDASLVSAKRGDFTYRSPEDTSPLSFFYVEGTPVWRSRMETSARISRGLVDETYRIEVIPEAAAIEKILVRLQPPRSAPIRWSLADMGDQQLAARRPTNEPGADGSELWEIMLPESKRSSITILGHRSRQMEEGPSDICVLSTPEAKAERSVVTVIAAPDALGYFRVESELPRLPLTEDLAANPFAVSRYLATAGRRLSRRVTVRPRETPETGAWIAKSSQHTRLSPQGAMLHEIELLVENYGQSTFKVTLPEGAAMRRMTVNGQFVPVTESTLDYSVPMNPRDRDIHVHIEYSESRTRLHALETMDLPPLRTSLPLLQHHFSLSVPPDWAFWGKTAALHDSWTSRLFGWLARPASPLPAGPQATIALDNPDGHRVRIFHRPVWGLAGWLVGCVTVLFVALQTRLRPLPFAIGIAACPLACLLVPLPLAPIVRGLFWGGLAGCVARHLPGHRGDAAPLGMGRWTTAHLLMVVVTVCPPHLQEQVRGEGPAAKLAPATYRVLIPDDETANGDAYVFVPSRMYQELVERIERRKSPLQSWVIQSFRYRTRLSSTEEAVLPTLGTVEVTARLHAFRPGQRIEFPLPASNTGWRIRQVTLNGEPIDWEFGNDARTLRLQLSAAGEQQVRYLFDPPDTLVGELGCDLPLVPHPDSTLELSISRDDLLPVINNRLGRAFPLEESRRQVIQLGACASAKIRWNELASTAVDESRELQLLGWLRIAPGAVTCDIALHASDHRPLPRTLRLDLGPSLRPLNSTSHPFDHLEDQTNRRLLELDTQSQPVVRLRCLVTNGGGLGELTLPQVRVLDGTIVRSIWAGTIDPSLSFEQTLDRDSLSRTPEEFVRAWQLPTLEIPDFVVSPTGKEMRWRLRTFPRRSISLAETSSRIVYSAAAADIHFEARIAPLEGQHFLHQLAAPPELVIHSLEVEEEDVRQPVSWTRDDSGMIHIMLEAAVGGAHQIHLHASLPRGEWGETDVPIVTVGNGQIASHEITILRDSTVSVELLVEESLQPLLLDGNGSAEAGLYLVASLLSDGEARPQAIVDVQPNHPDVRGQLVTTMRNTAGRWWADVDWSLAFTGGVPDEFVMESTADWGDTLHIEPPVDNRVEDLPDGRRQIVVQPRLDRATRDFRLRMSAPLTLSSQVVSPRLRLLDHPHVERLLVLPRHTQGNPLAWELTAATRMSDVPESLQKIAASVDDAEWYVLQQANAAASLPTQRSTVQPAKLLLADIRLDATDKLTIGDVRLLIHPRGSSFAQLHIPAGCQVVATLVDDRLAETSPLHDGSLRVCLGPSQLPQEIRVLCRLDGRATHTQRLTRTIEVPSLASNDVPTNLWSLARGPAITAAEPKSVQSLSAHDATLLRLNTYQTAIGEAGEALTNYSTDEIETWFSGWASRILALAFVCDTDGDNPTNDHDLTIRVAGGLRKDALRLGVDESDLPALLDSKAWASRDDVMTFDVKDTESPGTYYSSSTSSHQLRVNADTAQPARLSQTALDHRDSAAARRRRLLRDSNACSSGSHESLVARAADHHRLSLDRVAASSRCGLAVDSLGPDAQSVCERFSTTAIDGT